MLAKRLPNRLNYGLSQISRILHDCDCVVGNLENTVHDGEGIPEAFPGGGWAMSESHTLGDLKRLGFDMFACANNHSMDYGQSGLKATMKNLRFWDIPFAGIGDNLSEASRPCYFDCENGRVSLISVTSSFHDSYLAGPQSQDMKGRPGVNPLRHKSVYQLSSDEYVFLSKIIHDTGINDYHKQAVKEGYLLKNQRLNIGHYNFEIGETGVLTTTPNEKDLKRIIDSVKDARNLSDIVVVSYHGHQFNKEKEISPEFTEIFCRKCIEAGADVVFCHGPHLIRGIEQRGNGIIFYGLGNFILQHDQMKALPEEYYWKYGLTRQDCYGVSEAYLQSSANGTRGLNVDPRTWQSILVNLEINGPERKIVLYPIELDRYGLPKLSHNKSILYTLGELSKTYNTRLAIEENKAVIYWDFDKKER